MDELFSEKDLEKYLVKVIKEKGDLCLKLKSDYHSGLPDRLILLSGIKPFFCELKSKGKKPTKLQLITHDKLRELGNTVYVVDSKQSIHAMLYEESNAKEYWYA